MTAPSTATRTPQPGDVPAQPAPAGALPGPPVPASAADVLTLQNLRGRPAVSVLLSTTPAPRMTPPDAARLEMLLREAERRLGAESGDGRPDAWTMAALRSQALAARGSATRSGLALFVARTARGELSAAHLLDVAVRDRVGLGPVFATRDLIRSLHRTPRHLLLVLTSDQARLYDGLGDTLTEVRDGFPVVRGSAGGFFQRVDDALGAHLVDSPAPLVVAAPAKPLDALLQVSQNLQRLAGTVPGPWHDADVPQLVEQVRPVLLAYLRTRQLEALALLDARERQGRSVVGLQQVWTAARSGPVEMLAVEEDHFRPARLSADRRRITPADDVGAPDVLDDAVDEVIDLVLSRGGWVALVESGALARQGHLALTLRRSWSPATSYV